MVTKYFRYFLILVLLYVCGGLSFALLAERFFEVYPCKLCLMQRYALYGVGGATLLALFTKWGKWVLLLSLIAFLGITGFHLAVEQQWITYHCGKPPEPPVFVQNDPLKLMRYFLTVKSCKTPWTIFGISVTLLNFLAAMFFTTVHMVLIYALKQRK